MLSSVSGADIEVNHGGNSDFIYAYKDVNGTVSQSGVQGGSTTDADSLLAAATLSRSGDITLLSPANFNSQVSITSAGARTAAGLKADGALSAGDQTLLSGGTAVFSTGIQVEFVVSQLLLQTRYLLLLDLILMVILKQKK